MKPEKDKILWMTDHDYQGNYVRKILQATERNPPKPGTVNHVSIAHDDWCDLLAGKGACNCDPDVVVLPIEPANG
jgi:hypothetical protein